MPDSNDIVYEGYQIDFIYVGRVLFDLFGFDELSYAAFVDFLSNLWEVFTVASLIISFILVIGVIYAYIRYNQMGALEQDYIDTQERLYQELYGGEATNTRWGEIESHIASDSPNDWKLAIIEAEVMLEETLESAGYAGLTVGEKLKSASPTQFASLDDAWKAHQVRNKVAHSNEDFVLTKKIAQDAIVQYKKVFQEFGVI